ncbi:transmembrane protein 199-like [Diabrotica undecimpunctata]|uniref:transmembrane protein 199-like n=1 Tax=Diabrotica undecimpunctata TaxID=50387 RepID=UPI003B64205F
MIQTNTAPIVNPKITIKPSQKLITYIKSLKDFNHLSVEISNTLLNNTAKKNNKLPPKVYHVINEDDKIFIKSISERCKKSVFTEWPVTKSSNVSGTEILLSLVDLHSLHAHILKVNKNADTKVYLHEILEGSEIILPKNEEIQRNEELDRRCKQLQAEQANRDYFDMTKNVDSRRKVYPEDTVRYQLQQMNRHSVEIFQFVMSVAAGFAFGFIGVEILIGSLDFGFRLVLGIVCALTVALAELYFLAKKINEDLQFEHAVEQHNKKGIKLD